MTNELWFEKIDKALKVSNSIRNLDSWEAFESSNIMNQLKSSTEGLQDNESKDLRNWVGKFETWKESPDSKSFDFALGRNNIADDLNRAIGGCLMLKAMNYMDKAKNEKDHEKRKIYAVGISNIEKKLPQSLYRTDPKAVKKCKKSIKKVKEQWQLVPSDQILNAFNPESTTVYRWMVTCNDTLLRKMSSIGVYIGLFGILLVVIPFGIFKLVGKISLPLAFWSASIFSLFALIVYFTPLIVKLFPAGKSKKILPKPADNDRLSKKLSYNAQMHRQAAREHFSQARRKSNKIGTIAFASFACGGLFYLISSPVEGIRSGFSGNTASIVQWMLFYIDTIVNMISLSIPATIGYELTSIRLESGIGKILMILFQIVLAASIINLTVYLWSSLFKKKFYYETVDGLYLKLRFSPAISNRTSIQKIAEVEECIPPDGVYLRKLILEINKYYKRKEK